MPVWILNCFLRLLYSENVLVHWLQGYCFYFCMLSYYIFKCILWLIFTQYLIIDYKGIQTDILNINHKDMISCQCGFSIVSSDCCIVKSFSAMTARVWFSLGYALLLYFKWPFSEKTFLRKLQWYSFLTECIL